MGLFRSAVKQSVKQEQPKLSKKQAIPLLREQFIEEHPPVGSFDEATGNPVTEKLIRDRANAYVRKI